MEQFEFEGRGIILLTISKKNYIQQNIETAAKLDKFRISKTRN